MTEHLRTPDERFNGLPGFDYTPNYVDDLPGYGELRMHYLDEGPQDPVLGPAVMRALQQEIRGCPEPYEIADGGHFLQEWGDEVARKALEAWND